MKCYALTNDVKPRKKKKNLFLNSRKLLNEIHAMQCWGVGIKCKPDFVLYLYDSFEKEKGSV